MLYFGWLLSWVNISVVALLTRKGGNPRKLERIYFKNLDDTLKSVGLQGAVHDETPNDVKRACAIPTAVSLNDLSMSRLTQTVQHK